MAKAKTVTMTKSGCKPIEVNPDSVESMEAAGYSTGKAKVAAKEASGMSDAEKKMEIDAAGEVARKKAQKAGLTKAEVDADVEAAKAKAADELED